MKLRVSPHPNKKHTALAPYPTMTTPLASPQFSPEEIKQINRDLSGKTPQEILTWAIDHVDGLYQTTAFGLCVPDLTSTVPS